MKLRPYQERAVEDVLEYAQEHISGRLLLVVPGGGGKTIIGAELLRILAVDNGFHGLFWAHRRELVDGMFDHLLDCGVPRELVGVTMADDPRHNPASPIQVASVDTLRHRDKPPADIVISDEAHRDASDGRRKLRALYPDALHVGLTATPCRLDGRGLGKEYDTMIVVAQPSELIADGYLAPAPRIFTVPSELLPELKGVKTTGGDYELGELEQRTNRKALIGSIVSEWQRLAEGRRTIIFPVGVRHSRSIVARFRAAGVPAEHLDGEVPTATRRRILEALAAGTVQVVSSCGVLSEGVNVPAVKCVVMARPTKSLGLMIQQCSRASRPWEGVVPLILDHAGNVVVQKHGMPHDDREWSLFQRRRDSGGDSPAKVCQECNAVVAAGHTTCPECGSLFHNGSAVPAESMAELREWPRVTDMVSAFGKAWSLESLAQAHGIAIATLQSRIFRGHSAEYACTAPLQKKLNAYVVDGKSMTVAELAATAGMTIAGMTARLKTMTPVEAMRKPLRARIVDGYTHGQLTVIDVIGRTAVCACACGAIVKRDCKKIGYGKSCGCARTGLDHDRILGGTHGRLTALSVNEAGTSIYTSRYNCLCKCGCQCVRSGHALLKSAQLLAESSCGCEYYDRAIARPRSVPKTA